MKHELLAPAGDIKAGYAALYYGADAVYLGLTRFSARAGAQNFTADELDQFTAYAHSLKRKVFVALNTLLTEEEIQELPEIIATLRKTKVDALIIQDLGVFYAVKQLAPEIELHASTQMAVHNTEGAKFLHNLGFKRVVLARELSLSEIKEIAKANPGLDLEVFVHGALCYSYSGQCLFSALEFGKSANRGKCVYPCRGEYTLFDESSKFEQLKAHFFSMKDLALQELVNEIPALSLKIEGRKKSALYVAAVTNYYRHILDNKKGSPKQAEDIQQIFSRPWCLFHFKKRDKNVTDEEFVGHRGLKIGEIEGIYGHRLKFTPRRGVARFDGLQIDVKGQEKPFGFGIKSLFVHQKSVFKANGGDTVEVELPEIHPHLDIGAPVYLASSSEVKGKYDFLCPKDGAFRNYIHCHLRVEITENKIWAMCDDVVAQVDGNFSAAKDVSKSEQAVLTAFSKTKDSSYCFDDIDVINPDGLFAPASLLNELRRRLIKALNFTKNEEKILLPKINNLEQLFEAPEKIILNKINIDTRVTDFTETDIACHWFELPLVCRQTTRLKTVIDALYHAGVRHFVVQNYYGFEILKPYQDIHIGAGHFVYVMNSYAAEVLKNIGVEFATLALESSVDNMEKVINHSGIKLAQVIYGNVPLFTSAVCIRRNDCADCDRKEKRFYLKSLSREYVAISKNCQLEVFSKHPYQQKTASGVWAVIDERKEKCD